MPKESKKVDLNPKSFLNMSGIHTLINTDSEKGGYGLRLSGDALGDKDNKSLSNPIQEYYLCALKNEAKSIISNLPRKTKGDNKGMLKAFTLNPKMFSKVKLEKDWQPELVKSTAIPSLFKEVSRTMKEADNTAVRISDKAKPKVNYLMDMAIRSATDDLRDNILPRKTKGENKGDLKVHTITKDMLVEKYDFKLCKFK